MWTSSPGRSRSSRPAVVLLARITAPVSGSQLAQAAGRGGGAGPGPQFRPFQLLVGDEAWVLLVARHDLPFLRAVVPAEGSGPPGPQPSSLSVPL